MQWSNPFSKMIDPVLVLTEPPADVVLAPGPEAVAVGLLMRARSLLRAAALVADRMQGGSTDPIIRAILEACFTGAWLLADPDAYDVYHGHHRRKWRIIAEQQAGKPAPVDPEMRAELEYFLVRERDDMPPEANTPPFDQQAEAGDFTAFYGLYRMITRRAHPDLDAARTGLIEVEGGFRPNTDPFDVQLGDPYVKAGMYVTAKLGAQIDERLGWGRRTELSDLLVKWTAEAERALDAARAALSDEDPLPEEGSSG
jgi:hypothetical protein